MQPTIMDKNEVERDVMANQEGLSGSMIFDVNG